MKHTPANKGFSLIELMVVVSITSVIATTGLPMMKQFKAKAMQTQGKTQLRNLQVTMKAYYLDNDNTYPVQDNNDKWFTTDHSTATSCLRSDNPFGMTTPDCRKLGYSIYYVNESVFNLPRAFLRERISGGQRMVFAHCSYTAPQQQQGQQQQIQGQSTLSPPLTEGGLFLQKFALDTYLYSSEYDMTVPYPANNDNCDY